MTRAKPKAKIGRPRSTDGDHRYMLRHSGAGQIEAWKVAAATCALTLPEWMKRVLDLEAKRAHHVAAIKRG